MARLYYNSCSNSRRNPAIRLGKGAANAATKAKLLPKQHGTKAAFLLPCGTDFISLLPLRLRSAQVKSLSDPAPQACGRARRGSPRAPGPPCRPRRRGLRLNRDRYQPNRGGNLARRIPGCGSFPFLFGRADASSAFSVQFTDGTILLQPTSWLSITKWQFCKHGPQVLRASSRMTCVHAPDLPQLVSVKGGEHDCPAQSRGLPSAALWQRTPLPRVITQSQKWFLGLHQWH